MLYVDYDGNITYDCKYLNNFITLKDVYINKSDNSVHALISHNRVGNYDV